LVRSQGSIRSRNSGAASWWLLLALVLVAAAGFYIYYQQNLTPAPRTRRIEVAVADSSGVIPQADTTRRSEGGTLFPSTPAETSLTGPFVAPAPGFQSSRSGPVANLLDYARRMRFDPVRGTEFALPVDEYGRQRQVRLEPLSNLRRLDSTAFAEGRVIARIRSDAAINELALHNGENFLWVQGVLGAPIQAEVWSTSVLASPKALRLSYSPRPPANAPEDKDAFWLGSDVSNRVLWIACGRGWCHS
jgi:hypothetical protein